MWRKCSVLITILFLTTLYPQCTANLYRNVTRWTLPGIAEYRSALTLDWLAAEDRRHGQLAMAFYTESLPPTQMVTSDCVGNEKPATGKIARLMLDLLKNLEGDEGTIMPNLIQALVRSKLLVETAHLDSEPDLEALVETPAVMAGQPHATFPRVVAVAWMAATDPENGWCSLNKITRYLLETQPGEIARHMREIDATVARARFLLDEFVRHVTPNVYAQTRSAQSTLPSPSTEPTISTNNTRRDGTRLHTEVSLGAADVPRGVTMLLLLTVFLL